MLTLLVVLVFIILLALLFGGNAVLKVIGGIGLAIIGIAALLVFFGGNKDSKGQFYTLHICKAAAATLLKVSVPEIRSTPLVGGKLYSVGVISEDDAASRMYHCNVSKQDSDEIELYHAVDSAVHYQRKVHFDADGDSLLIIVSDFGREIDRRDFQINEFRRSTEKK
ncbi:hypothetical protein [Zhongshania aliphaticivorans]|uniref:hypothetical protein n=1 Tax=Zhongshania aliphaticivorans TaxID=1470434 RepID=UPI0012E48C87|nr:hypothetical protein [Zhongshania aliphaticivorans]CAA0103355.1 Uncharacterised protein [Zhongshania aliphaticivorans]